jgi:hypothetical protein
MSLLLIGGHGVGKTQRVTDLAKSENLNLLYYNSATLDPWADLVGIPVPRDTSTGKVLEFIRPQSIDEAELVFFDELNRSHPKVQNAVLEIIQFKTINGKPLKNLRAVWAAINPPGDKYQVSELDPALVDRFKIHYKIEAAPDAKYYQKKLNIPQNLAESAISWWEALSEEQKYWISPRRLEYLLETHLAGIDLKYAIPVQAPRISVSRLKSILSGKEPPPITPENITQRKDEILERLESGDRDIEILVSNACRNQPFPWIYRNYEIFMALSKDSIAQYLRENRDSIIKHKKKLIKDDRGFKVLLQEMVGLDLE